MNHRILIIVAVLVAALMPRTTMARSVIELGGPTLIRTGDPSDVVVRATFSKPVNAVGGVVLYDPDRIRVTGVDDTGSPVRLWLTHPDFLVPGRIPFEGIIPGGMSGGTAVLFTLHITALTTGTVDMRASDMVVYLDQAEPMKDDVISIGHGVAIRDDAPVAPSMTPRPLASPDVDIRIVSLPESPGRRLLAFDVRLEGRSVPELLVREKILGLFGPWRLVRNPYPLSSWADVSIIEVRAPGSNVLLKRIVPVPLDAIWFLLLVVPSVIYRLRR